MNECFSKLFFLYCIRLLPHPADLCDLPQYAALIRKMSKKQNQQLIELFDAYSLSANIYAENCFQQGIRFALSLMQQLYPPE